MVPVKAQTINENVFVPCIREAASRPDAPNVDKAMISSTYRFEGKDYYLIDLLSTEERDGWSIVAIIEDGTCKKVGDGFVNNAYLGGLPPKLQLGWYEKLTLKRLEEVDRETIKQQIKEYTGQFWPYEIKVFKKLGLLD